MNELMNNGVSTTHHFKRQLEDFCRGERISTDEMRTVSKTIIERVCQAHGGNVFFSTEGHKVMVMARLKNGGGANILVVFDEMAQGSRAIRRIASSRVVRQGQE